MFCLLGWLVGAFVWLVGWLFVRSFVLFVSWLFVCLFDNVVVCLLVFFFVCVHFVLRLLYMLQVVALVVAVAAHCAYRCAIVGTCSCVLGILRRA